MSGRFILTVLIIIFSNQLAMAWDQTAIDGFVSRIMKDHAVHFKTEYIPSEGANDVFEVESRNGKIILGGNSGIGIGSALNYYLRNFCHCLITWNGVNMNLPATLPPVSQKIRKISPYRYRYYLNYCTFNYSMAWWDWPRWQQEIDWMTLNGINLPLALTGEESIWNRVYQKMGFTKPQLDSFFCGPSYFSWFWMGNLDAWAGPLSKNWMDSHEALQKKILKAERAMGMKPVLPAFTGHVPPSFSTKFPNAKVKKTNWKSGFNDVSVLDPSDSLFEMIGQLFLKEQTAAYGTDHFYSADTFNENIPPTSDSIYLNDISKRVFTSMASTDSQAVWVMQGWMFHYDSAYWRPRQMQALLNAVPDDHMIILDLYSESFPLWKKTNAYYGKPWIWNMLHNFGGNISLWGRIENPAKDPALALHDKNSGRMMGIGLTPEAIEQNPVLYHLMLENVWTSDTISLTSWLKDYTLQRYGVSNTGINKAWSILSKSVYDGGLTEGGPESIITGRPTFARETKWTRTKLDYDPTQLVNAWTIFMNEIPALQKSDGFRYDIVDITRQVLANYANTLHQKMAKAFDKRNAIEFDKYAFQFIGLIDDMDNLLSSRKEFLLGKWLTDARSNGITSEEKDQYERNARNLITLWGDKNSPLHDYSCRQWSGLLKGFYKPRWQYFFKNIFQGLKTGKSIDFAKIDREIKDIEWKWVNGHEPYWVYASGDEVELSRKMFKKYRVAILNSLR